MTEGVGTMNYKHQYDRENLEEIDNELHLPDDLNESLIYQEYLISYVNEMVGPAEPNSWRDSIELYNRLLQVAQQ